MSWRDLSEHAAAVLGPGNGSAREARHIVEAASGLEGAAWETGMDAPATRRGVAAVDAMVRRRCAGEPLQYVIGRWGFRTLDLMVDRRVLIPRPETEIVAERALDELSRRRGPNLLAADLGTGSGAIALALVSEEERVAVWATDASGDALDVARANLAGTGRPAARVRLARGSWFDALPPDLRGTLDVVVSNPPYVADHESLPRVVADWEPAHALVAGPEGTEAHDVIVGQAPDWLRPDGSLVLELAPHQAAAVTDLARDAGFGEVAVHADLAGRDRVLVARR